MAPRYGAKAEKEQRLASIIGFAARILKQVDLRMFDPSAAADLGHHLDRSFPVPPLSKAQELDELGRSLWNAAIRLQQSELNVPGLIPQLRVFAFYLLDIAHRAVSKQDQDTEDNFVRVLRVSLKAGRTCIDHNETGLASQLFQKAAAYVETRDREVKPKSKQHDEDDPVQEQIIEELIAEYYLLRAALAWKTDRLDLVEYWLPKVIIRTNNRIAPNLIEKKADLLYEIGKAALKKKRYDVARPWLERSYDTIDTLDLEALTPDRCELRIAIMSDLVRALIGLQDAESISRANKMIILLEIDNPEFSMSRSLLQLNLLFVQNPVIVEQAFHVLRRIIQSIHLIESNFTAVMHQIHKLRKANEVEHTAVRQSVSHACQALDILLPRLLELGEPTWIEKVTVIRIWIVVSDSPTLGDAKRLAELFDEILNTTGKPFRSEATHASQSLLWKRIDASLGLQQDEDSYTWCRLACHALFESAGDVNKSKLRRKMMLNAIAKGDAAMAREAYYAMPESGKAAPITRFIMYKLALRIDDAELASNSLDGVLKASTNDATFLYACALETQHNGNRDQAIAALQKVLEYYQNNATNGIYLPALLRSIAKMIMVEMENGNAPKQFALTEVCKIFEVAMSQAKTFRDEDTAESSNRYQAELTWFAKYSYNLTLDHITEMHPELLVRYMTVCISFVELLREEKHNDDGLLNRVLLCRFLAASASVVLGRSEDNVERSLSYFLDARRQIDAFQKCLKDAPHLAVNNEDTWASITAKEFELLKYDLEALLRLQQWNDLDRVLGLCLAQQHSARWGTIADIIIHIHTHIIKENLDPIYNSKIPLVMEKIINASWKQDKNDIRKLARWIRCLFQMTLTMNAAMALKCVENAKAMANRARNGHSSKQYPNDELAWLATSAFNHAVDLFCAHDMDSAQSWAENALNLAMSTGQETGLHAALQAKWLRMQASTAE